MFMISAKRKHIQKIFKLQKKALRMVKKVSKFSHTSELFWALNILPFPELCKFNVLKLMRKCYLQVGPESFHDEWKKTIEVNNRISSRNREFFYIERTKSMKIERLSYFQYPKVWNEFVRRSRIQINDDFEKNAFQFLLNDYYENNKCEKSNCYNCEKLHNARSNLIIEKEKKVARVKKIIIRRGIEKKKRYAKLVSNF